MTLEQRKHFEYVRDVMHGDEEKEDKFCDNNCVWTDHHPDCVRSNKPEPVGFVVDLYNGVNTPSLPPTATVAWLNDNPKIGQILYTTPPQRTWVGLSDDEKRLIEIKHGLLYFEAVFFDIEAKLKEKNGI